MDLSMIIQPPFVAVNQELRTKDDVLHGIANLVAHSAEMSATTAPAIYAALADRERVGSTGFGHGIAIPHCRLEGVDGFVVGLVTVTDGVDFDAADGKAVRVVAFIVGPAAEQSRHLKLLSALSFALSSDTARRQILEATTVEAAIAAIGQRSDANLVPEQQTERRLFQVVVQDESIFDQLLEVFEGVDSSSVTVIESHNSGAYLSRLPLFSSLLGDAPDGFNRLIIAAVNADISNETVRQIGFVAGPLDGRSDLLVIVQDIHFSAGGLSV